MHSAKEGHYIETTTYRAEFIPLDVIKNQKPGSRRDSHVFESTETDQGKKNQDLRPQNMMKVK